MVARGGVWLHVHVCWAPSWVRAVLRVRGADATATYSRFDD